MPTKKELEQRIVELETNNATLYNDLFAISYNPHHPKSIFLREKYIKLYRQKHFGTDIIMAKEGLA